MSATDAHIGPDRILETASGFMLAKQLFTANSIGLFEALSDGPLDAEELASATSTPLRSVRILAEAMCGADLLERDGDSYRNGQEAATYLAGDTSTGSDLRTFLQFWDTVSYPHWRSFETSTRRAQPSELTLTEADAALFGGLSAFNAVHARMLCDRYDFGVHSRLLDLEGMSISFLTTALERHQELHGVFVNTAEEIDRLDGRTLDRQCGDRLELVTADVLTDPLPGGFDAVIVEHVAHRHNAEENQTILRRARESAVDGGKLLLVDFFLSGADDRVLDARFAGEYLVVDGTIVYPEREARGWLERAGWSWKETIALPGSPLALVAEAV